MLGPNFLEFTEHTRSVARLLFKQTEINCEDVTGLKFICCDLDTELTTVVDASGGGGREVVFLRENLNHFVPLIASHITKEELLPWNTNISTILARRRKTQENALHRAVKRQRQSTMFDGLTRAEEEGVNSHGSVLHADTLHQAHGTGLVPPCKVTDKFGERSGAEELPRQGGMELPSLWDKTLQAETHA